MSLNSRPIHRFLEMGLNSVEANLVSLYSRTMFTSTVYDDAPQFTKSMAFLLIYLL